jgi:hypothetical protein
VPSETACEASWGVGVARQLRRTKEGGSVNVLSLFAGIGGLELGLERAGMTVVGQVEFNPFCRDRPWRSTGLMFRSHDDVRTAVEWWESETRPDVDVVCGGFPCHRHHPTPGRVLGITGPKSRPLGRNARRGSLHFDPNTCSLKTLQHSLFEDSIPSSLTLPRSGSMQSGQLYQRAPWVRHTHVSACSYWPTPRASDSNGGGVKGRDRHYWNLKDAVRNIDGIGPTSPVLSEWLMGFPPGWTDLQR